MSLQKGKEKDVFSVHAVVDKNYSKAVPFRYELCVPVEGENHVEGYRDSCPIVGAEIIHELQRSWMEIGTEPFKSIEIKWSENSSDLWSEASSKLDVSLLAIVINGKVYATLGFEKFGYMIEQNINLNIGFPYGETYPEASN